MSTVKPEMGDLRLLALIDALFPTGRIFPAPNTEALASRVMAQLESVPGATAAVTLALSALDARFFLATGTRFVSADPARRKAFLRQQQQSALSGRLLQLLSLPFRAAYLLDEETQRRSGGHSVRVPAQVERQRWQQQIMTVPELDGFTELEADVVVVGSGAGGAAAAYELASHGLAVLLLEEGQYHDRRDFTGRLTDVLPKLYRASGATIAIGNSVIPIPVGRSVGGTTTINSGTCLRTPDAILQQWSNAGLQGFEVDEMVPWFEQVEAMLHVQSADPRYVGPIGEVIARGAKRTLFSQAHPLQRNALGCDGQGLCQFGCPTDAKQSTNVSYVPRALEKGAFLLTGMKAQNILWQGPQVVGLEAQGQDNGIIKRVRIKTRQVVVAAGTFFTPLFLRKNGIRNPWLGRNLSIHPCGVVSGYFPDRQFDHARRIPQGFGVSDLAEEGILFEGGTPPFAAHGLMNPFLSDDYMDFIEQWQHTAYFGFMIRDSSRGRVSAGLHKDLPFIRYAMNQQDQTLFRRGLSLLARMQLRAGAEYVHLPGYRAVPRIYNERELDRVLARRLKPHQLAITAYHPLGTARIAASPNAGVCDADHRVFGCTGLYVMDGSSVPSSLGANPQVTIMAMALKAANALAKSVLAAC
ncbi:GMC family oxidoreductase [Ketobacter alkanivorans]|uniref:GMC oxidoreductase n=1 Tax=Ketobacter alkanivorans TaxID=1917421 RepID=A0A2K9LLY1_9GAMM|nr:GMC family oxidoreductase [Ketobacter alkanivorans]AUM13356.1 GMC oxidoreductase [Ketobacter alkanivorans]